MNMKLSSQHSSGPETSKLVQKKETSTTKLFVFVKWYISLKIMFEPFAKTFERTHSSLKIYPKSAKNITFEEMKFCGIFFFLDLVHTLKPKIFVLNLA